MGSTDLPDEATGLRRIGKGNALADALAQQRRIVIGERCGGLAGDHCARSAVVRHEAPDEQSAASPRLINERQRLGGRPSIKRRRLHRQQGEVGGEQGRSHQGGEAGLVDDDMIDAAGDRGRLTVKRFAFDADDAEENRKPFTRALL